MIVNGDIIEALIPYSEQTGFIWPVIYLSQADWNFRL